MSTPRRLALASALALALPAPLRAAEDAPRAAGDMLFTLGVPVEVAASARATLVALFERQNPHLGRAVPDAVDELLLPDLMLRLDELMEQLTAMVARHLTAEQCRAITAFNLTPAGQRRIAADRDRRVGLLTELDSADARAVARFEATPAGQRLVEMRGTILAEVQSLGRAWGARATTEVIAQNADALRDRGFRL